MRTWRWVLWGLFLTAKLGLADPCGMVPPISLDGNEQKIERTGEQKTYVFRKGDVQTLVIHPAFQGNVDQFGMLIPFPTVPALRKVADNSFEQLENAIDPPVITYSLRRRMYRGGSGGGSLKRRPRRSLHLTGKKKDVVVLKEEAVGMYEVAVLEAGSASALKRWMEEHSYRFPDGMEPVCKDYVKEVFCSGQNSCRFQSCVQPASRYAPGGSCKA